MACPTSRHTMQNLWVDNPNHRRIFWCSNCGTIKIYWPAVRNMEDRTDVQVPHEYERLSKKERSVSSDD